MKKVIVIGAGVSGLASIKNCLDEGLAVQCYELTECIGGLWKFRNDSPTDVSVLQRSTIINSSKEMSAFSDFPPPPEFPNFMHNGMMWSYLELYAKEFNLLQHIKFCHKVTSCKRSHDYDETGRWIVKGVNTATGEEWEDVGDAVMVCNGHLSKPNMPDFAGLKDFKGKVIHTRDYKRPYSYEDKNILVIGIGNSAGDCAVELSTCSKKLFLSTRSGSWVLKRISDGGIPGDFIISRALGYISEYFQRLVSSYLEYKVNLAFDHQLYGIKPKHRILQQHPVVNDDLPNRIASGRVTIKGDIDRFTETGVIFKNEKEEQPLDVVIFATGYLMNFPFLEDDILKFDSTLNQVELYKYILPPHLKFPTLGVVGLIQPFGSIIPIAEAQSRWFIQAFTGKMNLPPFSEMDATIKSTKTNLSGRFKESTRYTLEADWMTYMDSICTDFGAKPSLLYLFLTDPGLCMKCLFGPLLPYQYRLQGPHPWSGARNAIFTATDRMKSGLPGGLMAKLK